jgi:hypothetical protein
VVGPALRPPLAVPAAALATARTDREGVSCSCYCCALTAGRWQCGNGRFSGEFASPPCASSITSHARPLQTASAASASLSAVANDLYNIGWPARGSRNLLMRWRHECSQLPCPLSDWLGVASGNHAQRLKPEIKAPVRVQGPTVQSVCSYAPFVLLPALQP